MNTRILLFNAGLITMDKDRRQFNRGTVLIQDDHFTQIGKSDEMSVQAGPEVECLDCQGRWIMPGLVNTHVHTSQRLGGVWVTT